MPGKKPGILASLMEIADKKRVFSDARFPYNRDLYMWRRKKLFLRPIKD